MRGKRRVSAPEYNKRLRASAPATDETALQEARPLLKQRNNPFWLVLNILSLDAPLVALVWQDFLARCYPSPLRPAGRWVLTLTVWAIYIADRLIDVRGHAPANEPARHRFYRRHGGFASVMLGCVVAADLSVAVLWLRPAVFSSGLFLAAGVVCYLAVFPFLRLPGISGWKQPCAAFLFTSGIFIVAWTGAVNPWRVFAAPAAAFWALCMGNMMVIQSREHGRSRARRWLWTGMLALLCVWPGHSRWFAAAALAALGLAAVDLCGAKLPRDARSVLADMVLFTPLLFR